MRHTSGDATAARTEGRHPLQTLRSVQAEGRSLDRIGEGLEAQETAAMSLPPTFRRSCRVPTGQALKMAAAPAAAAPHSSFPPHPLPRAGVHPDRLGRVREGATRRGASCSCTRLDAWILGEGGGGRMKVSSEQGQGRNLSLLSVMRRGKCLQRHSSSSAAGRQREPSRIASPHTFPIGKPVTPRPIIVTSQPAKAIHFAVTAQRIEDQQRARASHNVPLMRPSPAPASHVTSSNEHPSCIAHSQYNFDMLRTGVPYQSP